MTPINYRSTSIDRLHHALVAVYESSPESALRERSVSLNDAISELIYWRYATPEPLINGARIVDALEVLKTIKGAIDEAIEAKTNARVSRWDEKEGRNHG